MSTPAQLAQQSNDATFATLWDELLWRGLIHVSTDVDELKKYLTADELPKGAH